MSVIAGKKSSVHMDQLDMEISKKEGDPVDGIMPASIVGAILLVVSILVASVFGYGYYMWQ